jgi:hypothetical protein
MYHRTMQQMISRIGVIPTATTYGNSQFRYASSLSLNGVVMVSSVVLQQEQRMLLLSFRIRVKAQQQQQRGGGGRRLVSQQQQYHNSSCKHCLRWNIVSHSPFQKQSQQPQPQRSCQSVRSCRSSTINTHTKIISHNNCSSTVVEQVLRHHHHQRRSMSSVLLSSFRSKSTTTTSSTSVIPNIVVVADTVKDDVRTNILSFASMRFSINTSTTTNDCTEEQQQQQVFQNRSGTANNNNDDDSVVVPLQYDPKPWFDVRRPLEVRVKELLEIDTLHPADIVHPMMKDLIQQCCGRTSSSSSSSSNRGSKHYNSNNYNNNNNMTLEGLQRGQEVLDRCLVEKRRYQMTTQMKLFIPQALIQTILFGWCKVAQHEFVAQARMKEIVQLAIEEGKRDDLFLHTTLDIPRTKRIAAEVFPTVNLFNTYLLGLGQASKMSPQAALDGEAMLYDMIDYHKLYGWHTKPNTRSYTHVIVAYANTQHVGAGRRAYKILQQMKTIHNAEKEVYEQYEPPVTTTTGSSSVIKQPYLYNNDPHQSYDSTTSITGRKNRYQIVTPDAVAYTATLQALHISNRSPELVLDLLQEAVEAPGVVLDAIVFVVTIKALSSSINHENNALIRIDLANETERILRTMIQYSETKQFVVKSKQNNNHHDKFQSKLQEEEPEQDSSPWYDEDVETDHDGHNDTKSILYQGEHTMQHPSVPTSTTALENGTSHDITTDPDTTTPASSIVVDNDNNSSDENGQESSSSSTTSQETQPQFINDMETRKSLQIGYNACIHAWALSFCHEAAPKCESLLYEMLHSPLVQPNTVTFNTCLHGTYFVLHLCNLIFLHFC